MAHLLATKFVPSPLAESIRLNPIAYKKSVLVGKNAVRFTNRTLSDLLIRLAYLIPV